MVCPQSNAPGPFQDFMYELAISLPHGTIVVYLGESGNLWRRMTTGIDYLTSSGLFVKLLRHLSFDADVSLLVRV